MKAKIYAQDGDSKTRDILYGTEWDLNREHIARLTRRLHALDLQPPCEQIARYKSALSLAVAALQNLYEVS